ncbi:hypothetical protein RvY_14117-3 [Ramazzottius varieornatus]|uniref:Uncharacterized protein n=1 Tax=Ramazzottius varieornatus TaxID=947166 RepID=A0A1D1VYP6_RAMVA|nr:hypothetical protein RvY_14117-3 [Ramazzottius varieornatus]
MTRSSVSSTEVKKKKGKAPKSDLNLHFTKMVGSDGKPNAKCNHGGKVYKNIQGAFNFHGCVDWSFYEATFTTSQKTTQRRYEYVESREIWRKRWKNR